MPEEFRTYLVRSGAASKVLKHANYSPRIVEWMCESRLSAAKTPEEFEKLFLENLANPSELWSHAFENQLTPEARDIVWTMSTIGDSCKPDDLLAATLAYRGGQSSGQEQRKLQQALAELEGNFIEINSDQQSTSLRYHNPSVKDFTDHLIRRDPHVASVLFERAIFFDQLSSLLSAWPGFRLQVSDDVVLKKARETILSPRPFAASHPALSSSIKPARRLADLLDHARSRSRDLQLALVRDAIQFFNTPPKQFSVAQDWIRLYEHVRNILGKGEGDTPTHEDFLELVLNQMGATHEFRDILPYLEGHPMLGNFSVSLVALAEDELVDLIQNRGSSSDMERSLEELTEVLRMYAVEEAVDLSEAEALAEEIAAGEEAYADQYQDEYMEKMYDAREEERSVYCSRSFQLMA